MKINLIKFTEMFMIAILVVGVLWVAVPVQAQTKTRVIKPVVSAPDYNGMYSGGPYTGSARYTTLYRDNQDDGVSSGCRGEGCGKHPGVDIATASGTDIVLPLSGEVVISRCDSSWGGLLVIRSSHPSRSWENIYQTFAHLKARQYSYGVAVNVGDYINAGTVIGKSGGGIRDACRGNSTGAHLHYQVDKDDGNSEPYYPSSGTLNYRDDSYIVSSKTYNPMLMLQGGYRWKFAQDGNRELWDLYNLSSWGVSGNALWMDGDYDPYITRSGLTNCGLSRSCSSSIAAEASDYSRVYLDLYNVCPSTYGKVYFTTNTEPYFDETKTLAYFPTIFGSSTGPFNGYISGLSNYKWSGVITGLRVDPSEQCSYGFDPTYYGEIGLIR